MTNLSLRTATDTIDLNRLLYIQDQLEEIAVQLDQLPYPEIKHLLVLIYENRYWLNQLTASETSNM